MATRNKRQPGAWNNAVQSGDEQYELKRRAVLREAARAFSANGYHATSLLDVAKSLGVTKTALYYYVETKQEILFECHMLSHDLGDQAMAEAIAEGRDGREKIALFTRRYLERLTGEIGSCAVLVEFNALDPENRAVVAARRDEFDHTFRKLISEGIADGSLRQVDPKLTVFFFMGAVNWLTRWFQPNGQYSGEYIAQHFSSLLDESIRAR